jgi:hypothetical protein
MPPSGLAPAPSGGKPLASGDREGANSQSQQNSLIESSTSIISRCPMSYPGTGMMFPLRLQPASPARRHGLLCAPAVIPNEPNPKFGHSGRSARATIFDVFDRLSGDNQPGCRSPYLIPLLAATCLLHPGGWRVNPTRVTAMASVLPIPQISRSRAEPLLATVGKEA